MQIDATSFLLQLVNFVVLVWLLHRFLYRPVLGAIDRRRAAIERSMADARATGEQAMRLRDEAEQARAAWQSERVQARVALEAELAAQRTRGLAEVADAVRAERERLASLEEKRLAQWRRETEQQALGQAARFAGRLLERLAGPELDSRLVEVLIADLAEWDPAQIEPLAAAARAAGGAVTVETAHVLPDALRSRLAQGLSERLRIECHPEYRQNATLVAGLCVAVGPWLLQANLRDELRAFTRVASHAG